MKTFQTEILRPQLESDIAPLLQTHWEEIGRNKEVNVLNPDYPKYYEAQSKGLLKVYTMREDGVLLGYVVFFIGYSAHYQGSIQAVNDVLYIDPDHRGTASIRLMRFAEQQLLADNVDIIHMHMKIEHDQPRFFKFLGYVDSEIVREKVIKKGVA